MATAFFRIKSLKTAYNNHYLIADAALYVEETIKLLAEEKQLFITRVPQRLKEAKAIVGQAEQVKWDELKNGYAGCWFESDYAGVKQRWLLVRSVQAKEREKHILDAAVSRDTERALKDFKKLCRRAFASTGSGFF